jgi:hypothetical protein
MVAGDAVLESNVASFSLRDRPYNEHDTGSVKADDLQGAGRTAPVVNVSPPKAASTLTHPPRHPPATVWRLHPKLPPRPHRLRRPRPGPASPPAWDAKPTSPALASPPVGSDAWFADEKQRAVRREERRKAHKAAEDAAALAATANCEG